MSAADDFLDVQLLQIDLGEDAVFRNTNADQVLARLEWETNKLLPLLVDDQQNRSRDGRRLRHLSPDDGVNIRGPERRMFRISGMRLSRLGCWGQTVRAGIDDDLETGFPRSRNWFRIGRVGDRSKRSLSTTFRTKVCRDSDERGARWIGAGREQYLAALGALRLGLVIGVIAVRTRAARRFRRRRHLPWRLHDRERFRLNRRRSELSESRRQRRKNAGMRVW